MSTAFVSVVIVTYNSEGDIEECLSSLAKQDYPDFEVIVVDNGSEDSTVELVKEKFPAVSVVENIYNYGYAKGNNIGIRASGGTYVAVLNPDTVVESSWLSELVRTLDEREDVAACQSRILFYDRRDTINAEGNDVNYLGFTWCRNYGKKSEPDGDVHATMALSGCSTILRRDVVEQAGLFDEDFFMYLEDTDLSLRIRRMGYDIVCNPKSIVYHKYRFRRGKEKFYHLEKNRLMLLLKNYHATGLLKILPPLVLMEGGLILLALFRGWLKQKVLSYIWIVRSWRTISAKRSLSMRVGGASQRETFAMMSPTITFEEIQNPILVKAVNPLLRLYYRWVIAR